jgi:hypothetical protein
MRFKGTEIVALCVAGIAFAGSLGSAFYTYTSRNRELDIELVKVGIGILRADPKETQTIGAREWAIDLIETHSGRRFSQEARSELLQYKLGYTEYFNPHTGSGNPYTGGNWSSSGGFGDPGYARPPLATPKK